MQARESKMNMYYSCLIFAILLSFSSAYGELSATYYKDMKCPGAEQAVTDVVAKNIGQCAGIIRLHFHDCFVKGCDGSVLLDSSTNNPNPEKSASSNNNLRGFEVIQDAKKAAEAKCVQPNSNVVSCADVLAFAARDCVKLLAGFTYDVLGGRLDGKISSAEEADKNLPGAKFNFQQLKDNFAKKKLSWQDLVALSGAHSIGVAGCPSFSERYTIIDDKKIDRTYAEELKKNCSEKPTASQDFVTPDILDIQWYKNMRENKVLFFSDWALRDNTDAENLMQWFATTNTDLPLGLAVSWRTAFTEAMKRMGNIIELGASDGEIRKVCNAVN